MSILLSFAIALLHSLRACFRSQTEQALVELALRQQLAVLAQAKGRPKITSLDRAFWVLLRQVWPGWRDSLVVVRPETVVRWHRNRSLAQNREALAADDDSFELDLGHGNRKLGAMPYRELARLDVRDDFHRLPSDGQRAVREAIPAAILDVFLLPPLEVPSFAPRKRTFPAME